MKAFRLIIKQTSANYRKPETIKNKMTYPLPPFSTVIGALHNACGYTEYKEMNLSIQGKYESMHREPYTDYCFLNRLEDDRGILVWLPNASFFSNAFVRVAHAQKSQGNSFRKGVTIQVENQNLLDEYRRLKDLNDSITEFKKTRLNPVLALIKKRKKTLKEKKKARKQEGLDCTAVLMREKELKEIEKQIKERFEKYKYKNYTEPLSHFRNLVKSVKYYEILNNIELVIHVQASDEVLHDLEEHWTDIKSIGRSEDMVDVQEAKIVELQEKLNKEVNNIYSAYIDYDTIKRGNSEGVRIYPLGRKDKYVRGTVYYLNKNYEISPENGKRIFQKKKVVYTSNYEINKVGENVYIDEDEYIVNFI